MKASVMVAQAARTLNLFAQGETIPDEDQADILEALNQMLHSWELDGIHMGHETVGLDDELYVPESMELAVRYNLAITIAPEYERAQLNPVVVEAAPYLFKKVRDYYSGPGDMDLDRALTLQGEERRFSILSE